MVPEGVGMIAAATAALGLGLGLGFRWGKLYGMKLGIEARDFAESFGIGRQGVQTGSAATTVNPYNPPFGHHTVNIGAIGGGGGSIVASGGNGGVTGYYYGDLYKRAVQSGMSHADAMQRVSLEMQKHQQQQLFSYGSSQSKVKDV
jgi:hypothetical protein